MRRAHLPFPVALPALLVVLLLAAPAIAAGSAAGSTTGSSRVRAPCAARDPLRQPFFGDLHVHTSFSFDANALGVRTTPREAYRFARGERLGLQPFAPDGSARRSARLDRPLDFAAVTDHAELLGEVHICETPETPGHDSYLCGLYRRWPLLSYVIVNSAMLNIEGPERYGFCGEAGASCREAALGRWARIQRAAEEAQDHSARCEFTSFVGYEWSGAPGGNMLHRNVIFRNATVQEEPTNYIDVPTPEGLWERLYAECLDRDNGCDVLAIPHNTNLSGGLAFRTESANGTLADEDWARRRAGVERLVEVIQHKGASECRVEGVEGRFGEDELCGFELLRFARMAEYPFESWWNEPPPRVHAREALAEGLVQQQRLGVNPFQLGIIGSTDTHLGAPGLADEAGFIGHAAGGDTTRSEIPVVPDRLFFNPGGLAVIWAEENSRDALFDAMQRRETYGTSGPRMLVRMFAGWELPEALCERRDFARAGYASGVPMGGDLAAPPAGGAAPRIAVRAARDQGGPGGLLERVQVVKVWLEDGEPRERVFDVAGRAGAASVDPLTCTPRGPGAEALCTVWTDPQFDPDSPALYYARVLENPSCRWSAHSCVAKGVRCDGETKPPAELRYCCEDRVPRTIQERAWTSPVWWTPPTPAR